MKPQTNQQLYTIKSSKPDEPIREHAFSGEENKKIWRSPSNMFSLHMLTIDESTSQDERRVESSYIQTASRDETIKKTSLLTVSEPERTPRRLSTIQLNESEKSTPDRFSPSVSRGAQPSLSIASSPRHNKVFTKSWNETVVKEPQIPTITEKQSQKIAQDSEAMDDITFIHINSLSTHRDYPKLYDFLIRRDDKQRLDLAKLYWIRFKQDITKVFIKTSTFEHGKLLHYLSLSGPDLDATIIRDSLMMVKFDYMGLRYILSCRTADEISRIEKSYLKMYRKNLIMEFKGSKEHALMTCFLYILLNSRSTILRLDHDEVMQYEKKLTNISKARIKIPIELCDVMCKLSFAQLKQLFECYKDKIDTFKQFLDRFHRDENSKLFKDIFLFCQDPLDFHLKHFKRAIKQKNLIHIFRIISMRDRVSLSSLAQKYEEIEGSDLMMDLRKRFQETDPLIFDAISNAFI